MLIECILLWSSLASDKEEEEDGELEGKEESNLEFLYDHVQEHDEDSNAGDEDVIQADQLCFQRQ